MLNHQSPTPLYRQLADELSRQIRSGELPVDGRIPSEPELAKTFGIGRPTVRQATDCLVRRGLLERRRGAGTFVVASHEPVDLFTLGGTAAAFHGAGLELITTIISPPRLLNHLPSETGPLASQSGYVFTRVGSLDNKPVLLEQMALQQSTFPEFEKLPLSHEPLSALVEHHYHRRPTSGHQTLRAHSATALEAEILEIDADASVLLVERTLDFGNALNAFYARMLVVTFRVALTQTLNTTASLSATTLTRDKTS
ncbi:MAG: GntR family transcriptional regulator [Deltaproteobacteria bacterium]|nr:GntR family transcriptional regulator [Deltaproteobacteria bacterium]